MNVDREIVLEDTIQHSLTQMQNHIWQDIEKLATTGSVPVENIFEKSSHYLDHLRMVNSMLKSIIKFENDGADHKKCENSVEFRRIAALFKTNSDRFLLDQTNFSINLETLENQIYEVTSFKANVHHDIIPYISLEVFDLFIVKIVFSLDNMPLFTVAHCLPNEKNKSPFDISDFKVYRTLSVYFSRVLPYFMKKYQYNGMIEFVQWLKSYENLFTSRCEVCDKLIEKDLTGDLLPPIVRTVGTCYSYHIKCAPFEIELPDFGYITLMSEDQLQSKTSHSLK